ncbi:hypothetical protein ETU09_04720 [Apibacter muscae]|uniref:Preprotein translocase subunit YajC n=1 Tax=Apibacter muscae TaxID=2509004 RepID=A0A563DFT0_9FLAO|nr:hypothetical protein [Apibacter muscae]TWP29148.1 hypothetical protein ETU09_04720 [Apibacter muscae]
MSNKLISYELIIKKLIFNMFKIGDNVIINSNLGRIVKFGERSITIEVECFSINYQFNEINNIEIFKKK